MLHIEMTIWDNSTSVTEKADTLLWCEHAINKIAREYDVAVKMIERFWAGFTAEINIDPCDEIAFVRAYNRKLCRLHYWCKEDSTPLWMNYRYSWDEIVHANDDECDIEY